MSKTYGYARISRKTQNIERQVRNIQQYAPDAIIYQEAYTGRQVNRPKFQELLKKVKPGDTVIFDSVSRMSRDASAGIQLYFDLYDKHVTLIFLKEQHISTTSYERASKAAGINLDLKEDNPEQTLVYDIISAINKFMVAKVKDDIAEAFRQSEKEVADLRQRTSEGLQTVKERNERIKAGLEVGEIKPVGHEEGTKLNTKKAQRAKADIIRLSRDFNGTLKDSDCMKCCEISRNTYYRLKRELRQNS